MSHRGRIILIGVLFLFTTALRLRFSWTTVEFVFRANEMPKVDLPADSLLTYLADAGEIRSGDRLLALNGIPVATRGEAARFMTARKVGAPVTYTLDRKGTRVTVRTTIQPQSEPPDPYLAIGFFTLNILTPMFGSLLGFFVVFRRPSDRLAWELLAVLFGLSGMAVINGFLIHGWGIAWSVPAQFLAAPSFFLFATGWFWFALDFPERGSGRTVAAWLRWPAAAYACLMGVLFSLDAIRGMDFPHSLAWVRAILGPLPGASVRLPLTIIITLGFANLAVKSATEKRPSHRRRLSMVLWGLTAGLTPLTLLQFYGWSRGVTLDKLPIAIWLPALMMLFLVPATLAYALVVHKAMDVGVVLRQGLQYALARRSTDALRLLLAGAMAWMMVEAIRHPTADKWMTLPVMLAILAGIRLGIPRLRSWIDRRFFREAINTERMLTELSEQVHTIVDAPALLATVKDRVAQAFHAERVTALHRNNGHFAADGIPPIAATSALAAHLTNGTAAVYLERPGTWLATLPPAEKQAVATLQAELLVPVRAKSEVLAILALGPRKSEEPYSRADIRLLETVAAQTALALQNAQLTTTVAEQAAHRERLQREIEIARDVQMRLLPKRKPSIPGLDFAGHCRPAQLIGGDYFDYFATPSGAFAFAIGDIAGKGIPAALLMSNLQAGLRGLTLAGITDLHDLLAKLNTLIYDSSPSNRFATFFYCLYEPGSRRLVFSSAGHNPAVLRRASGEVEWLRTKGIGLGLTRSAKFEQMETTLHAGDSLLLYTDGLSEAQNEAHEEFTEERLGREFAALPCDSAEQAVQALVAAVDRFAGAAPQHDDMTLIVIRAS